MNGVVVYYRMYRYVLYENKLSMLEFKYVNRVLCLLLLFCFVFIFFPRKSNCTVNECAIHCALFDLSDRHAKSRAIRALFIAPETINTLGEIWVDLLISHRHFTRRSSCDSISNDKFTAYFECPADKCGWAENPYIGVCKSVMWSRGWQIEMKKQIMDFASVQCLLRIVLDVFLSLLHCESFQTFRHRYRLRYSRCMYIVYTPICNGYEARQCPMRMRSITIEWREKCVRTRLHISMHD